MQRSILAFAAIAAAGLSGSAEVIPREYAGFIERSPARRSDYRQGRRFRFSPAARGGNPAGTKLAKLAHKGLLGKCRIR